MTRSSKYPVPKLGEPYGASKAVVLKNLRRENGRQYWIIACIKCGKPSGPVVQCKLARYCGLCRKCSTAANIAKGIATWRARLDALAAEGKKACASCKRIKKLVQFGNCKAAYRGLSPWCKNCHRVNARLKRYNISKAELRALVKSNNGICHIRGCLSKATDIDHCYSTGRVRGHLCNAHNVVLRRDFKAEDFIALAEYLKCNVVA